MYYTPAILELAGFRDKRSAILVAMAPAAVNALGTVGGMWLIDRMGRRCAACWLLLVCVGNADVVAMLVWWQCMCVDNAGVVAMHVCLQVKQCTLMFSVVMTTNHIQGVGLSAIVLCVYIKHSYTQLYPSSGSCSLGAWLAQWPRLRSLVVPFMPATPMRPRSLRGGHAQPLLLRHPAALCACARGSCYV